MTTSWSVRDKRAVVFGAGGSIGSAVATELATEGAEVFLAGRTGPCRGRRRPRFGRGRRLSQIDRAPGRKH
jgi:NAD(P)-dependent dehydrogenase (short-subunit alcohol dehydrogenase family)